MSVLSKGKTIVHWLPRAAAILFIIFMSLFATDVFTEGYPFFQALLGFLIHLIPTFLIVIALVIAWRWPRTGGLLFALLGVATIFAFDTYEHVISFLLISMPLFVVGALFILDARERSK